MPPVDRCGYRRGGTCRQKILREPEASNPPGGSAGDWFPEV